MRVEAKKEIYEMLAKVGKGKTARKLTEKFEKTGVLSKREMRILRALIEKRVAA